MPSSATVLSISVSNPSGKVIQIVFSIRTSAPMKVFSYIVAHMGEGRQQEGCEDIHAENGVQKKSNHGDTEITEKKLNLRVLRVSVVNFSISPVLPRQAERAVHVAAPPRRHPPRPARGRCSPRTNPAPPRSR